MKKCGNRTLEPTSLLCARKKIKKSGGDGLSDAGAGTSSSLLSFPNAREILSQRKRTNRTAHVSRSAVYEMFHSLAVNKETPTGFRHRDEKPPKKKPRHSQIEAFKPTDNERDR